MGCWVWTQNKNDLLLCEHFSISERYEAQTLTEAQEAYNSIMSKAYYHGSTSTAEKHAQEVKDNIFKRSQKFYSISCDESILGTYRTREAAVCIMEKIQLAISECSSVYPVFGMPEDD